MSNHSPCSRTFRQHKCTDRCNIGGKKRTFFPVGRWRHHTKGVFTLASSFSNRQNLIFSARKLKTPLKTSSGNVPVRKTSNKLCPSYIILSGLPWKIVLDQKPSSSSSAATTSWSIFTNGWFSLELSYGFSFRVFRSVSIKSVTRIFRVCTQFSKLTLTSYPVLSQRFPITFANSVN